MELRIIFDIKNCACILTWEYFTNNKTLGTHFTDKWDKLLGNLGNLQGLILIKKANKGCDELLIELLKVLDDKIVAVNKIVQLNEDLYTTSSS
jgi:hypothetical protein